MGFEFFMDAADVSVQIALLAESLSALWAWESGALGSGGVHALVKEHAVL